MYAKMPVGGDVDEKLIAGFETVKEIVAGIRTVRKQKQLPQREALELDVKGPRDTALDCVLIKIGNLSAITDVEEKNPMASAFIVGATEYSVPLNGKINVEEEIAKLNKDLEYYTKFLAGVEKKLGNERFVANAPEAVVAVERKKKADAEEKLAAIRASLASLQG